MSRIILFFLFSAGASVAQSPEYDPGADLDKARLYWAADERGAAIAIYEAGLLKHRSLNEMKRGGSIELDKICDAIFSTVNSGDLAEPIRGLAQCPAYAVTEWLDVGSAADLISQVRYIPTPIDPPHMRGREGFVDFEFDVTPSGLPRNIVVIQNSSMIFERSALEALKAAKFRPAKLNGVSTWHRGAKIRIKFLLDKDAR